jgi:hypothetical protein
MQTQKRVMNFEHVKKWISEWRFKKSPETTENNLTVTKTREE